MANICIPTELLTLNAVAIELCDCSEWNACVLSCDGPDPIGYYVTFGNGWTASIQRHPDTYGYSKGLWEVAHRNPSGVWVWDTLGTGDVLGYLSWEEVIDACVSISEL